MDFAYPAKIVKRKNAYDVQFIDLDDAFTYGDTLEEALDYASEVLSGVILARLDMDVEVPKPSKSVKGRDIHYVLPDAKTQSALLIREAFAGRNVAQIARSMDTSWPAVNRLKNPDHWPTLKQLERALRAAGKQLVIGMRERADATKDGDEGASMIKGAIARPARPVSVAQMKAAVRTSVARKAQR